MTTPRSKHFVAFYVISTSIAAVVSSLLLQQSDSTVDALAANIGTTMNLLGALISVLLGVLVYKKYPGRISLFEWNRENIISSAFLTLVFGSLILLSAFNLVNTLLEQDYISFAKALLSIPLLLILRSFFTYLGKNSEFNRKMLRFTAWAVIIAVVGLGIYVYLGVQALGSGMCGTDLLEKIPSPDGTKTAIVFVVNCGATSDWSAEISIENPSYILNSDSRGNIYVADSDHGNAHDYNRIGGPNVEAVWVDKDNLEIRYSEGSRIFKQAEWHRDETSQTHITYKAVTFNPCWGIPAGQCKE